MPYLEMKGITKVFPGVIANNNIDFTIERGKIHALLGENGAGKSTLMRILYGLYKPERGEINLAGDPVKINNPHDAIDLGIGMVHQEFQLVPSLTVAENVALGYEPKRGIWTDKKGMVARVRELSDQFGLQVNPELPVREVSVGVQQRVEILKLLYRQAQLLILDEPTAVLTPQEVDSLFEILRRLTGDGHSIILITHKLKEVMSVCQSATVLRNGEMVGTVEIAQSSEGELARMMVGKDVERHFAERQPVQREKALLTLEDVSAVDERKLPALREVNFSIHEGEILGIAGVEGNGQSELVEVVSGLRAFTGQLRLNDQSLTKTKARKLRELGLAVVPENRSTQGLNLAGSVADNLIANRYFKPPISKRGILSTSKIRQFAGDLIERFDIKTDGPDAEANTLSGGNAQKIVIARELSAEPSVLVVAHPTRGLDVSAAQNVHSEILRMREEKAAVLLVSADLDELLAIADRILVLFEGAIVGEVDPQDTSYEELGLLMAGHVAAA